MSYIRLLSFPDALIMNLTYNVNIDTDNDT